MIHNSVDNPYGIVYTERVEEHPMTEDEIVAAYIAEAESDQLDQADNQAAR